MSRAYAIATIARALVVLVLAVLWYETEQTSGRTLLDAAFTADLVGLGVSLALVPRRTPPITTFAVGAMALDAWILTAREGILYYLAFPCTGTASVLFTAATTHELTRRDVNDPPSLRLVLPSLLPGAIAICTLVLTFCYRVLSGAGAGHIGASERATVNRADEIALVLWTLAAVAHVLVVKRARGKVSASA